MASRGRTRNSRGRSSLNCRQSSPAEDPSSRRVTRSLRDARRDLPNNDRAMCSFFSPYPDATGGNVFDQSTVTATSNSGPSCRKRGSEAYASHSPKRGKLEGEMEERLSDEANTLSVRDKDEWMNMVSPDGTPCMIRIRLPLGDGGRVETVRLNLQTKLSALYSYIGGRGLSPLRHSFVLSFPRREYTVDDANATLEELGFNRTEMVHVDRIPAINGDGVGGFSCVFKS